MDLRKEKGITLVALIITIVILIILAAVTISSVMHDGFIDVAINGTQNYASEQYKEIDEISKLADKLNDAVDKINNSGNGGGTEEKKLIKFYVTSSNDKINGEYTAEEGMTWAEFIESEYNPMYDETHHVFGLHHSFESMVGAYEELYHGFTLNVYNEDDMLLQQQSIDGTIYDGQRYMAEGSACIFPSSNILISQTEETSEAKDIALGQDIAYYNFDKSEVEIGTVKDVYIHYKATDFVRYTFEDGTYLEATDYHPVYTKDGWRSLTRRNGYEVPEVGNEVKTAECWKKISKIDVWSGLEDCYDFEIISKDGEKVDNYFANGTLVQSLL